MVSDLRNNNKIGTLYGVSVGTGDPELITIKALKILQNTKIIAFPKGIHNQKGVAETIIQEYLQPHQQKLSLSFPYTLSQETLCVAWEKVSLEVWQYLKKGENVAFACEGDISFYSTFTYLALTLQKLHPEVKIERIAGISSPMAAASAFGLPLTMQEEKLVILPALYSLQELEFALDWAEIVVLMKVASVYAQVWDILAKRDLFNYAYLVEKATTNQEKIYTSLRNYPNLKLSYFSILIISQRKHLVSYQ
ncbi:precorrin-2 C(20)-methyltransferase [Geminocystis sp.]|uniref:precorrin-2 C(20)-methyltransferase n=1 Tax=Geminocystis sp. TaxID=2664100 RepID=UPI00359330E7